MVRDLICHVDVQTQVVTAAPAAPIENRFESIESAHEFVTLLREVAADARESIHQEIEAPTIRHSSRYVEGLRLADYKVCQLESHLATTARLLNDLRTLRRLILNER